jgi:hypothetical protein
MSIKFNGRIRLRQTVMTLRTFFCQTSNNEASSSARLAFFRDQRVHCTPQPPRVETESYPEGDERSQRDGGEEVSCELVVVCRDPSKVLQVTEGVFDEVAALIAQLVISDGLLAVRVTGHDRHNCKLAQMLSQTVGIIALIREQVSCPLQSSQQKWRDRAVCDIAAGQHEDEGTTDDVRKGMDFGGLATPRRLDRLIFRPPFPRERIDAP